MGNPLILTVKLDDRSELFFNQQRVQYFPPERNLLKAHLTLFHHLPNTAEVLNFVETLCKNQQVMALEVTGVVSLGKGVAYKIMSTELAALHKKLQHAWRSFLTPQDAQGLWPHITVQNKVTAPVAKTTLQILQQSFVPFTAHAVGLTVWEYLNGPWQLYQQFSFKN